jgi:hypothetical protein
MNLLHPVDVYPHLLGEAVRQGLAVRIQVLRRFARTHCQQQARQEDDGGQENDCSDPHDATCLS